MIDFHDDDYMEGLELPSKYVNETERFVNAAIDQYNESVAAPKEDEFEFLSEEAKEVVSTVALRESNEAKFHSFSESLKRNLTVEALYKIFSESVSDELLSDRTNRNIMRSIVNEYVNENGYDTILGNIRYASPQMSMVYNAITETAKSILEECDKKDPDSFTITSAMKDNFFDSLDYANTGMISDQIKDRVADSISDFITANTKDHESVENALKRAQEKIDKVPEGDTELKEEYEAKVKREIADIRNAPKSIFHAMVSSMCESVLKHKEMQDEFMHEGHLDIDKIVSRVSLMYTFIETLNTAKIDKVDKAFLESAINDLKD